MKKKWQKPELVVLVRSTPEENVLQACKMAWVIAGPVIPGRTWMKCGFGTWPLNCSTIVAS